MLENVQGMKLEFEKTPLRVGSWGFEISKNQSLIQEQVNKCLKQNVLVECEREAVEYISSLFLREKTDGTQKFIHNMKKINKYLEYKHFNMKTLQKILTLIHENRYMANSCLTDGYCPVKIDSDVTSFLKFLCNWKIFKFAFLPNGLSPVLQKFTKLRKSYLLMLTMQEYKVAICIDGIITVDQDI